MLHVKSVPGWRAVVRWVGIGLVSLGLVACRPIEGPSGAESPTGAEPMLAGLEAVRYGDAAGAVEVDLGEWPLLEAGFMRVLASAEGQARTFFDAERFAAEVAGVPHVWVEFDQDVEFAGQGAYTWRAQELVVVVLGDEPLLLGRVGGGADWSVYLPTDAQATGDWIGLVRARAGGA